MPKIGHNIMYSDNCPAQYKCRQNLFMIVTSADNNGSCQVHKFAQKFCFKGSWDATGKLIKSAILKNEMKHDRCANAYDCYLKLTRDITKNRQEDVNKNWLRWERNLDQKIQQKKVLKTNWTFIGLGTEHKEEYERLTSLGNQHIIYTDRESIPDMAPIVGTHSLYQLQGDSKKISDGLWNLYTTILPCSCPPYRFNPSNHATCEYTYDRDLKTIFVSLKTVNDDVTDNPNGINKLTVHQLKE